MLTSRLVEDLGESDGMARFHPPPERAQHHQPRTGAAARTFGLNGL